MNRILRLIVLALEGILAIPVIGGLIIVGTYYSPLFVMFFVHLGILIYALSTKTSKAGPIVGLVTCLLGWIPFLGWALHVGTFVVYLVEAIQNKKE